MTQVPNQNRRGILAAFAAAAITPAIPVTRPCIRAVAFDGIALFDPRPVEGIAREIFGERAREVLPLWRSRQFEYTWLRTVMGRYADFAEVTAQSLTFVARTLGLQLADAARERLVRAFFELRAWPDVKPALERLRRDGYRVAVMSNFTEGMLRNAIDASGIRELVDATLSTDVVRAYKPDERAYAMSLDALSLTRDEICFVAFAGWDVAGAKAFGHPVYWANRLGSAMEELGVQPDHVAPGLAALPGFLLARR
jgi:2-haloacid dehalogenase